MPKEDHLKRLAVISAYNEIDFITGAIKSVRGWADRIIVVDGAWTGFPLINNDFKSTDGTIEEARRWGAEVIIPKRVWLDQVEKRNVYLVAEAPEDWYLILDADERLVGWPEYPIWGRAYNIIIMGSRMNSRSYNIGLRLVRNTIGLHYEMVHNYLIDNDGVVESGGTIKDCIIQHLAYLRSKERNKLKDIYADSQWDEEMPRRKELGIA